MGSTQSRNAIGVPGIKAKIIRHYDYDVFPSVTKSFLESVWKCKLDADWDNLYDSIHHANILHFQAKGYPVYITNDHDTVYTQDDFDDLINQHGSCMLQHLTPTHPNFMYPFEFSINVITLMNDCNGFNNHIKISRRVFKRQSLVILMRKLNNVHKKRQDQLRLIISNLCRTSRVKCIDLIDQNVFNIVIAYRGSPMLFTDVYSMRISLSRYQLQNISKIMNGI